MKYLIILSLLALAVTATVDKQCFTEKVAPSIKTAFNQMKELQMTEGLESNEDFMTSVQEIQNSLTSCDSTSASLRGSSPFPIIDILKGLYVLGACILDIDEFILFTELWIETITLTELGVMFPSLMYMAGSNAYVDCGHFIAFIKSLTPQQL